MSHMFANQALLLSNAAMLAMGTLSTAVLGFAFWWFAARAFAPEAVGYAAAAISLMNLLAHIGEFGLGPFLMGEISLQKKAGPFLVGALFIAMSATIAVSLIYIVIATSSSVTLGSIVQSSKSDGLFVLGCALTALTLVLDQALVGLLHSRLQLVRNIAFAASKLFLLIVLSLSLARAVQDWEIFGTWILGQAFSVILLIGVCAHAGRQVFHRPNIGALRQAMRRILGQHVLSIAVQAPGLILPFVVAVALSPEINAAFYAAWTLLNVALLVPASLAAVLFSVAARQPDLFCDRLRVSLLLSLLAGLATSLIFLFFSQFLLWIFNPAYAGTVGNGLHFLGFGTVGMAVKYHYLAVQRSKRQLGFATIILTAASGVEILAAVVASHYGGIAEVANAWVMVVLCEGALLLPVVCRELSPHVPTGLPPKVAAVAAASDDLDYIEIAE